MEMEIFQDKSIMHSIFTFKNYEPSTLQSKEDWIKIRGIFFSFLNYCNEIPTSSKMKQLLVSELNDINLYPDYGCALVIKNEIGCSSCLMSNFYILGLDGWSFEGIQHSCFISSSKDIKVLKAASINAMKLDETLTKFYDLLYEAQNVKGEKRNASFNEVGHQKTPAFIEAILKIAINSKVVNSKITYQARGGFTDVGLHTGGIPRDTIKPLFFLIINYILDKHDAETLVSKKMVCRFLLWIMEGQLNLFNYFNATSDTINIIHRMLDVLIENVAEFYNFCNIHKINIKLKNQEIFDSMSFIKDRCKHISVTIYDIIKLRDLKVSEKYLFCGDENKLTTEYSRNKCFTFPLRTCFTISSLIKADIVLLCDINAYRERSLKNIDIHPSFQNEIITEKSCNEFIAWTNKYKFSMDMSKYILILTTIERCFFKQYSSLLNDNHIIQPREVTFKNVEKLVEIYRKANDWIKTNTSMMKVELYSKELLIVWIAFCLIHKICKEYFPIISNYATCLHFEDLEILELSDKIAIDSMLIVGSYIHTAKINSTKGELFSLRDKQQQNTYNMIINYFRSDENLSNILQQEIIDAEKNETDQWNKIKQKKAAAQLKRTQISGIERLIAWKEQEVEDCEYSDSLKRLRSAKKELSDLKSKLYTTQNELRIILIPPDIILQPIPKEEKKAMITLFFCHMNEYFESLCRLSFMAQRMLELDLSRIGSLEYRTCLIDHYNMHSFRKSKVSRIFLLSQTGIPQNLNPKSIDDMNYSSQGVWYPDSHDQNIAWYGGNFALDNNRSSTCYNPFRIVIDKDSFIESLPKESRKLQLCLSTSYIECKDDDRGNQIYAKQDNCKTEWMNWNQLETFANSRSHPYLQLRNLCDILHNRSLPFTNVSVRILLQTIMYHAGPMFQPNHHSSDKAVLKWRHDMHSSNISSVILNELHKIISDLSQNQQSHSAFYLFGIIASYFIQWDNLFISCSHKILVIMNEWIYDLDQRILQLNFHPSCKTLRALQCLCYLYGILSLKNGNICRNDYVNLIMLMANAKNIMIFKDQTIYDADILHISQVTSRIMIERFSSLKINEFDLSNEDKVLTDVLKIVYHKVPEVLQWSQVYENSKKTFRFESVFEDHFFMINITSGEILVDGAPSSRLPEEIVEHQLFMSTFGKINFEVTSTKGTFQTVHETNSNCHYNFHLTNDSNLLVVNETFNVNELKYSLRLLDRKNTDKWNLNNILPIRLLELCSHWYCQELDIILLRPIHFLSREVEFIIFKATSVVPLVYKVPLHLKENLVEIITNHFVVLPTFDRLLLNPQGLKNFTRFDKKEFIHVYITSEQLYKIEFPRYSLSFLRDKDGFYYSENYKGFYLELKQHFKDGTLRDFHSYLLLRNDVDERMVIIPEGKLIKTNDSKVIIETDSKLNVSLYCSTYKIHPRFKILKTEDIMSRLKLASIYACIASSVYETRINMTGDEYAIELLRQCFVNRPLTTQELYHLNTIMELSNENYTLKLLCFELKKSTEQLLFLFKTTEQASSIEYEINDLTTGYINSFPNNMMMFNPRLLLSEVEFERLCGSFCINPSNIMKRRQNCKPNLDQVLSINDNIFISFQNSLSKLISSPEDMKNYNSLAFPLNTEKLCLTTLGCHYIDKIKESWKKYQSLPNYFLNNDTSHDRLLDIISSIRNNIERDIIAAITDIPFGSTLSLSYFHVLQIGSLVPKLGLNDLLRILLNPTLIYHFNPFLSEKSATSITDAILYWLELSTMEDKINRLQRFKKDKEDSKYIQELLCHREWKPKEHPYWIVFEVEQQISIRPQQYKVAMELIQNPGSIIQLNMGEGKTRVILPMLILYWTTSSNSNNMNTNSLLRFHFLPQLIDESYEFLHTQLCASVFNVKLFLQPYQRDIALDNNKVDLLLESLLFCKNSKGVLIQAPEFRQSLELKYYELIDNEYISSKLENIYDLPYLDMHDETDELFRYKTQLIYANGEKHLLKSGPMRWESVECILFILKSDNEINSLLHDCNIMKTSSSSCKFSLTRFLVGKQYDIIWKQIVKRIVQNILNDPPYHLRWINNLNVSIHEMIEEYLSNPEIPDGFQLKSELLDERCFEYLLSLRCFLAFGILQRCLERRHRVNYGISRPHFRNRKMAMPFKANDTPSIRSEFSDPMKSISYTLLSYYYDGLSKLEVREALQLLLAKAMIAREYEYNTWYNLSVNDMIESDKDKLNKVDKIDLSNESQFALLYKYYSFNMLTINFWLNEAIFPSESTQYPYKLSRNMFHLADNSCNQVYGFSGTKDTSLLLPKPLTQLEVDDINLQSTDGKMISILLQNQSYHELRSNIALLSVGEMVLNFAIANEYDAIIDVGALMSGISNDVISSIIAQKSKQRKVVYNDNNKRKVKDHKNLAKLLLNSPYREKECFVYFDEAHCRGSDMKLNPEARAIVTLGPLMTKDKLLQAIARMRQIDKLQKIIFVGTEEISNYIRKACNLDKESSIITSEHVLYWVLKNTISCIGEGILEWGKQSSYFAYAKGQPKNAQEIERSDLCDLYNCSLTNNVSVSKLYNELLYKESRVIKSNKAKVIHSNVNDMITKYGSEIVITSLKNDLEIEREVEIEKEVEVEREVEIPTVLPRVECSWDYEKLFHSNSISDIKNYIRISSVGRVLENYVMLDNNKNSILWHRVYMTENFMITVESSNVSNYLRKVDNLLYFPDDYSVVLISEKESNDILNKYWSALRNGTILNKTKGISLMKLSYMKDYIKTILEIPLIINLFNNMIDHNRQLICNNAKHIKPHNSLYKAISSCILFDGQTKYDTLLKKQALKIILPTIQSKNQAKDIVEFRRKTNLMDKSDLEEILMSL